MEPFLEKFFPDVYADMKDSNTSNYCLFDSQLLTAFTSSLYIAGLFASLCASKVTQAFGRRASMLLGGAAFIVGAALGGLAVNVFMLILGRVLLGVGVGFTNQAYFTGSVLPPLLLGLLFPPLLAVLRAVCSSVSIGNGSTRTPRSNQQWIRLLRRTRNTVGQLDQLWNSKDPF